MKKELNEHRLFRNQMIGLTIMLFAFGGFMLLPFEFWSDDVMEGATTCFAFGFIFGFLALFNILSYAANKRDYEKIQELKQR